MIARIDFNPHPNALRYRFYWIEKKKDFYPEDKDKTGFVVIDEHGCNIMPGATWFPSIAEAKLGVNIFIAVRGDPRMFWEIMQPFVYTPGEQLDKSFAKSEGGINAGDHYMKHLNGVVMEIGLRGVERISYYE